MARCCLPRALAGCDRHSQNIGGQCQYLPVPADAGVPDMARSQAVAAGRSLPGAPPRGPVVRSGHRVVTPCSCGQVRGVDARDAAKSLIFQRQGGSATKTGSSCCGSSQKRAVSPPQGHRPPGREPLAQRLDFVAPLRQGELAARGPPLQIREGCLVFGVTAFEWACGGSERIHGVVVLFRVASRQACAWQAVRPVIHRLSDVVLTAKGSDCPPPRAA